MPLWAVRVYTTITVWPSLASEGAISGRCEDKVGSGEWRILARMAETMRDEVRLTRFSHGAG